MLRIVHFVFAIVLGCAALDAASQVTITDSGGARFVSGSFKTAATPDRPNAYLYCYIWGDGLLCGAYDGASLSHWCSTSEPRFKALFPMIGEHSTILFSTLTGSNACLSLQVGTGSRSVAGAPSQGVWKTHAPVFFDAAARYAMGTIAQAPGSSQEIGCIAQSSFANVQCFAVNEAGAQVSCRVAGDTPYQSLADQLQTLTGLNNSSFLYFQWHDDPQTPQQHTCDFVHVYNASYYLP